MRAALVLGDDGFLHERADVGEVVERLVTFGVGLREATHADGTVARVADLAVGAVAAVTERREDDMVANLAVGYG